MAEILKGAPVAQELNSRVIEKVSYLAGRGIVPCLATVRTGENESDIYYEQNASRRAEKVGINVKNIVLPADISEAELIAKIHELNDDSSVHGVLIFRPLPKHIDDASVRAALSPEKDIDGITDISLSGVFTGNGAGFCPCTAEACTEILDHYGIDCIGKRVTVIGRSLVIGKPAAMLLMAKNATVTVCHTKTADLTEETKRADILIVSTGRARYIGAEHVSEGQTVIDVGINSDENGGICGDVSFSDAEPIVKAITPVPGGVGTVTTSVLLHHVVQAAIRTLKS